MKNLWELGEGIGFYGNELALHRIECPFCSERGNLELDHRAVKKKANSNKKFNFDTYKCGGCAGYVMVLWSSSEVPVGVDGMHDFRVLPRPVRVESYPEHWPEAIGRFWVQAHRTANDQNWDAAALMARSALQVALREQGGAQGNLKQQIDELASKGIIPPYMQEWAHNLRDLRNESADPDPGALKSSAHDVHDVIGFLDFFLEYMYDLPHQVQVYRQRRIT